MTKTKTVDDVIEEFRNGRDVWSRNRVELFVREISRLRNHIAELEKQSEHWKLQYMGHAESLDFAKMRLEELEEQTKRYTALENPESVEAYAAIGLYIQRFFDAEKRERLIRRIGSQSYVEMGNRIKALEALIKEFAGFDPPEEDTDNG